MDELERRRQVLMRRITALDEELATLEAIPKDKYPDLTVIRFKMRFKTTSSGRHISPWFNYAAIKIKGNWYTTGTHQRRVTWEQLQQWWADNEVKKLRVATGWAKLEGDTVENEGDS